METQSENSAEAQADGSFEIEAIGKKVLHKSMYLGGDLFDLSSDIMLYLQEFQGNCPDILNDSAEYLRSVSRQLTALLDWMDQSAVKS